MDVLMASNLEDTLRLKEKSEETSEKDWDKMNRTVCGLLRSYLTQDIKYHVLSKTSTMKIWEILEKNYLTKIESLLLLKRLYCFQIKKGLSTAEHMNNYTKLLIDLVNVNVDIEEENKTLILLNSLPDEEYEIFVLTLINGKKSLNYNDTSVVLVNYEVRRKDKQSSSSSTSAEVLAVRGRSFNQKGKGVR